MRRSIKFKSRNRARIRELGPSWKSYTAIAAAEEKNTGPNRERDTESTRAKETTEEPVFRYVDRAKRIALFPETRRDVAGEAQRQIQRHGTAWGKKQTTRGRHCDRHRLPPPLERAHRHTGNNTSAFTEARTTPSSSLWDTLIEPP